jgi:hypothetical protein
MEMEIYSWKIEFSMILKFNQLSILISILGRKMG